MACACGSKKDAAQPSSYTVKSPDGTESAYRTKIEAEAAAKRVSGSVIRPVS